MNFFHSSLMPGLSTLDSGFSMRYDHNQSSSEQVIRDQNFTPIDNHFHPNLSPWNELQSSNISQPNFGSEILHSDQSQIGICANPVFQHSTPYYPWMGVVGEENFEKN